MPVVHAQLTADDFDGDDEDEEDDEPLDQPEITSANKYGGVQSLVQRLVDHPQGDAADKYDWADTFSQLTADELVESNEQAYDG